ncbi:MAG TPA: anti-sigma factor [Gaiellaceae bacterium]|nr:anti-sigma factor [Gaiellaceae bacterium]
MTREPNFDELVGAEDLTPEEAARLERVHDLLVAAGPPPELPPRLADPTPAPREDSPVAFLPRRRAGLALALAAALALVTFVGGFIAGQHRGKQFATRYTVPMRGTAFASNASAVIKIGSDDSNGNWPLKVVVHGLKQLPKGQFYEMYLTRHGKAVATCGTFRLTSGDSVQLNAPYNLRNYSGWIVTREGQGMKTHPVVLRTSRI